MSQGREIAIRVFAGEYRNSTMKYNDGGERSPTYVITPMGARISRIFVTGVLTEVENVGTEAEPMWRAKVVDPTGVFFISAGKFQPVAASTLSKMQPPQFVAVIGKSRVYSPEEGTYYLSVRAETIRSIEREERHQWVVEAANDLKRRIDAFSELLRMENPDSSELVALGYPPHIADGVFMAYQHYGEPDLYKHRAMLTHALKSLLPEFEEEEYTDLLEEQKEDEIDTNTEEMFMEIVEALDKDGRGAPWKDILEEGKKRGLTRVEMEEIENILLGKGLLYEPELGKIKKT